MSGHFDTKQFQVRQVAQLHSDHFLCNLPTVYTCQVTDIALCRVARSLSFFVCEVTIRNEVHSLARVCGRTRTKRIFKRRITDLFSNTKISGLESG